ncbi:MAG TPA: signal recognition particle protein [Candidatus Subteraquimicrobiales bacterium]
MFDNLTQRLQKIFSKLKSFGRLSEKQVEEALREVRLALLEADVNFKVVKDFIAKVKERAVGSEVLESLTPAQQVVKIVDEELTKLMGSTQSKLTFASNPPTIIMLVGLHGSGKTTATAKLARHLKSQGKRVMMIAADVYRPAAQDQLKILAEELEIPVFMPSALRGKASSDPVEIAVKGTQEARSSGSDVVILDTAGRFHIDEEMMKELQEAKKRIHPHQILLVADAMTGQDAVNLASVFEEKLDFDGVILTKLDGDARGGAALSIKAVTGKPIKFVSMGEKLDTLEPFHPDRMASRILEMGDILTLVEKAQSQVDAREAQVLQEKLLKDEFNLEDFQKQLKQIKRLGPISEVMKMIPGVSGLVKKVQVSDKDVGRLQAIIQSMTPEERKNPEIINGSRRLRIAKGSGTNTQEVNKLLNQFNALKKMVKQLKRGKSPFGLGKNPFPFT